MAGGEKPGGFTLVELLLAATLGAMVITAAFTSISVVLKGYRQYKDRSDTYEPARMALARMSREISAAFLSPHTERTRFVGVQQEVDGILEDQLTFMAVVNNPEYSEGGESDLSEVQYYIDLDEETPERWLQVRYDPTPDDDPFSGGASYLLGPRVVSMSLRYFDGEIWLDEWDSKEELPMAVSVTLGVAKDEKNVAGPEDLAQFSTIAYLEVYRAKAQETGTQQP